MIPVVHNQPVIVHSDNKSNGSEYYRDAINQLEIEKTYATQREKDKINDQLKYFKKRYKEEKKSEDFASKVSVFVVLGLIGFVIGFIIFLRFL